VLIALGIACFLIQLVVSYLRREQLRDVTGDPWNGRTLEWSTSSPPPDYNFAFTPVVHDTDAWHDMKKRGYVRPVAGFKADPHAEEHGRRLHHRDAQPRCWASR
jgi:cytochrome o ubiquinol oxidase subunit 1